MNLARRRKWGPHPESVRETAIRKIFTTGGTYAEVGKQLGVSPRTIENWVRDSRKGTMMTKRTEKKTTDDRSPSEKLRLLQASSLLTDDKLGAFLRHEGIKEGDLERWQAEAISGLQAAPDQTRNERRIKELEREAAHHKKRLQEACALLELQKKFRLCGQTRTAILVHVESRANI